MWCWTWMCFCWDITTISQNCTGATEFKPNMFFQHLDYITLSKTCFSLNPDFAKKTQGFYNGHSPCICFIMLGWQHPSQPPRYTRKHQPTVQKSHGSKTRWLSGPLQSWGAMWHGTGTSGWKEGVNRGWFFQPLIILTGWFFPKKDHLQLKRENFIWTKPPIGLVIMLNFPRVYSEINVDLLRKKTNRKVF